MLPLVVAPSVLFLQYAQSFQPPLAHGGNVGRGPSSLTTSRPKGSLIHSSNGDFRATPSGKAEDMFPSDDSDYKNTNGSSDVPSSSSTRLDGNFFQASELAHPTQSKLQIGPIIIVDPIDIIADWVSDWFVEQSLQWKSSDGKTTTTDTPYILESYSPGSALDAIAQASSPYTPLSYQIRTFVRVFLPSLVFAAVSTSVYPSMAEFLVHLHTASSTANDFDATIPNENNLLYTDEVLKVLSNDLSQYVQNILTTCALLFGMLVGQTYYFMYQQQEHVFYALFAEVTEAKSLLEQISLMTYGRPGLYPSLLSRMNDYVQNDLKLLSVNDPTTSTSQLPKDDPLESILYATSVGVPGVVYDTVKSLRQARATRCGALQRKLPNLHIFFLRLLGVIVLTAFPVCGSGSQALAPNVLILQSYMFGILVFGLTLVLNVVEELRNSRKRGAYNVDGVLGVMVGGLELELQERLDGKIWGVGMSPTLPGRITTMNGYDELWNSNVYFDNVLGDIAIIDEAVLDDTSTAETSRRSRAKNWLRRKLLRN